MKTAARSLYNEQKRGFGTSVYLWTSMPKLGPKASDLKQQFAISKGVPEKIEAFDKLNVRKLTVGLRHSAAITADGNLYTFGSGNWGVLGHGTEKDSRFDNPQMVEYFVKRNLKVKDVALGEYHTVVLTEDGSVYTWGYGGKVGLFNWMFSQEVGALGHGDKKHHFNPKKVEFFEKDGIKIDKISAGLFHTNALDTKGNVYTWGRGVYGVLGNGSNAYHLDPTLNEELNSLRQADANKEVDVMKSADEFSAVLMKDSTFWVWGKNDRGQLGVGSGMGMDMVESEKVPVEVMPVDDE